MDYQVFNFDKGRLEPGKKVVCPRCKGYGTVFPENKCWLCTGRCFVIQSRTSHWVRPLYKRIYESKIY